MFPINIKCPFITLNCVDFFSQLIISPAVHLCYSIVLKVMPFPTCTHCFMHNYVKVCFECDRSGHRDKL